MFEPKGTIIISRNERFLKRLQQVTEANLSDPKFGVKFLCEQMELSQPNLWRKVQEFMHQSRQEYIRTTRLKRASLMLKNDLGTVSEIADAVGFGNKSYFARCFQGQFGVVPSQYRQEVDSTSEVESTFQT